VFAFFGKLSIHGGADGGSAVADEDHELGVWECLGECSAEATEWRGYFAIDVCMSFTNFLEDFVFAEFASVIERFFWVLPTISADGQIAMTMRFVEDDRTRGFIEHATDE